MSPPIKLDNIAVTLINGVYGDPLIHIRLVDKRRSLLFDLGDASKMPVKNLHQVTDIFISHGHMDHIFGFLTLLRTRLSVNHPCRLYGPPGITKLLHAQLSGFLWDRIGSYGPKFQINEYDGHQLTCFEIQAGIEGIRQLTNKQVIDHIVLDDPACIVRAVALDHGTLVIAYSIETPTKNVICPDKIRQSDIPTGTWIRALKEQLDSGQLDRPITLPDGQAVAVQTLADKFTQQLKGKKLVYATDLADHQSNRNKLTAFAKDADHMLLEASFINADSDHARDNGHLTTRACGEIAQAANVASLLPFHFSKRYIDNREQVYAEIEAVFTKVVRYFVS